MAGRHKYRLKCQTINKQNKLPCKAKGYLTKKGTIRCRLHGGFSSGPKTIQGKIKALKNLKNWNEQRINNYIRDFQRHRNEVDGRSSSYNNLPS